MLINIYNPGCSIERKKNSDLCHKHWSVKVSVLLLMGSSDHGYAITAKSTAGKHLFVEISDVPIHIYWALANARVSFFSPLANLFLPPNVIGIHTTRIFHTPTSKVTLGGARLKTAMGHLMKRRRSDLCKALRVSRSGFFFLFVFLSPGLSGDNTGSSSKKRGDGPWWQ